MDEIDFLKEELFNTKADYEEKEANYKDQVFSLQSKNDELSEQDELHSGKSEKISELKIELERITGELSTAQQQLKKYESDFQLAEEDRSEHRYTSSKISLFIALPFTLYKSCGTVVV